jgi:predicted Na+-dependent transporter
MLKVRRGGLAWRVAWLEEDVPFLKFSSNVLANVANGDLFLNVGQCVVVAVIKCAAAFCGALLIVIFVGSDVLYATSGKRMSSILLLLLLPVSLQRSRRYYCCLIFCVGWCEK